MNETAVIALGFILPCLMTTLGAVLVFFFKKTSKIVNMITIGLAAGIMLSASIWSLLVPALDNASNGWGDLAFLPVVLGFVLGGLLMLFMDFLSNKIYKEKVKGKDEISPITCPKTCSDMAREQGNAKEKDETHLKTCPEGCPDMVRERKKAFKMFTAITIHNIPEGLSVGFAIGTAVAMGSPLLAALMFAVGIALQNFPEGLATALPIYTSLGKKGKAFWLATLSGLVEPLFAMLGFFLAAYITSLLPWLLAFAAGAMIYVIVEEMIPEIQVDGQKKLGTWSFVLGFVVMMILDVCL